MSLPLVLFYVIAFVTAFSALGVVFSRNIVRAAVWLLFTLLGVSMTYFLLGAEFLGAAQLIIYVGGTLVLVVFGVMLTAQDTFLKLHSKPDEWLLGGLAAGSLFVLLVYVSIHLGTPEGADVEGDKGVSVETLGAAFLNVKEANPEARLTGFPKGARTPPRTRMGYLLPFEIVSVHLLVVLIGAAYLARAKRRSSQRNPSLDGLRHD